MNRRTNNNRICISKIKVTEILGKLTETSIIIITSGPWNQLSLYCLESHFIINCCGLQVPTSPTLESSIEVLLKLD